jgi:dipeptidyl-peptidase-4
MDDGCERYVCVHGSLDQAPTVEIHETSHAPTDESCSVATPIFNSKDLAQRFMRLTPPTLFEITAADDVTTLHGAMYIPDADTHGPPPYPCVVSVYGGPHAQTVQNSWHLTADVRAQSYRARGMVVLKLDNRGSARRGQLFERAIVGNLGACEIEDQALGVEYLVREGLVDPSRVGIFGWSYGGFLSALALSRRPEVFTCAVAGAPVARWEWYDAHYTERYMGTPESNPDGYRKSSALSGCADVAGRVLVVHGVIDENVHFRHSTSYLAALEDVGKRSGDGYVFMPFSDERHVPRGAPDRMYMEQSMQTFLEDALRPGRRDGSSRVLKRDGGPVHAPA